MGEDSAQEEAGIKGADQRNLARIVQVVIAADG
jgi:hypothetical protein